MAGEGVKLGEVISKQELRLLVEGKLDWDKTKALISGYKDEDRFQKFVEVFQEKVSWEERILLPLSDRLFIVEKGEDRVAKCICGYEFGDYRENWKLRALIYVREGEEEIEELYPYPSRPDPRYCEVREYICPGCGNLLEVDCVPFGYPVIMDVLPDLDTFYSEWLGKPLRTKKEFKDLSYDVIETWLREKV